MILINWAKSMETSSVKTFFLLLIRHWSKAVKAKLPSHSGGGPAQRSAPIRIREAWFARRPLTVSAQTKPAPTGGLNRAFFALHSQVKAKNLSGGWGVKGSLLSLGVLLLLVLLFSFTAVQPAFAAGPQLEIVGPGLRGEGIVVSSDQIRGKAPLILPDGTEVEQYDQWYSSINTWPSKIWYRGQGIRLKDLLAAAGGLRENATQINFISSDGFKAVFTVQELLQEPAFRFPNFIEAGLEGHMFADSSNAVPVEPMIAHQSCSDHSKMEIRLGEKLDSNDANHLLFGQRSVTHQNNPRFAKYVTKIEVLTDEILTWDPPTATPAPGFVPAGTLIELSSPFNDEDKVHYTLDGSDPTINSPMYNYVAKRWWTSRRDKLAEINRPIAITGATTIKAITIGPGRSDSSVVTFDYQLQDQELKPDSAMNIILNVGQQQATIGNRSVVLDAAPYLKAETGRTLVPLRFISEAFQAELGWDSESGRITVELDQKEIVLALDSAQVRVNGAVQTIDCPPELHPAGRTFVPLRFISELLGARDISYDSKNGRITILK